MCHWKKWIWPGLVTVALVTMLATWFNADTIENDLAAKARAALAAGHPWAEVALDGRDLTLRGMAPDEQAQADALSLASAAYDVRVATNASILIPEQKPYRLSGEKTAEGITLSGFVPNEAARKRIIETMTAAMPGLAITDTMTLARGAPDGLDALAGFGARQFTRFSTGRFDITDTAVSVEGRALTPDDYEAALRGVAEAVPANGTLSSADIEPAPLGGDFVWSAAWNGSELILDGYAPDPGTRSAIEARARQLLPSATIENRLRIASGAPEEFPALTDFALAQLPLLSAGKAGLANAALSIEGTALGVAEFGSVTAALGGKLPAGMTIGAQSIEPPVAAGPYGFAAERAGNEIVLTGFAPDEALRAGIVSMAQAANPGANVIDRLAIATGVPDGMDWLAATGEAVRAIGDFTKGRAAISGTVFSVEGETADDAAFSRAQALVTGPLGGGLTMGSSDIGLPKISPYTWSAARSADGSVTLDGFVPAEAVKIANADLAGVKLGAVAIADGQKLGAGAPGGFEAATSVALQAISRLDESIASITGTTLSVTGVALSQSARDDIARTLASDLPEGWTGAADISVKAAPEAALTTDACQQALSGLVNTNTVLFEPGQAVIRADSFGLLDRISYTVRACGSARVEIAGHTDSDGSDETNQALSETRAKAVADYLAAAGVDVARLETVGFGESQPVADNATPEGKAKNRRIELRVVNP